MKQPDADQLLGRIDYFEFWREEASRCASTLGVDADQLAAALDEVRRAVGDEWVSAQLARKPIKLLKLQGELDPQVIGWIRRPSLRNVAATLELATYLRALANIRGLDEVIPTLRSDEQFPRSLTQLAFAFRFARAGVANLELEPAASMGRRADIYFEWDAVPYLVECYKPDPPTPPNYSEIWELSLKKIASSAQANSVRVLAMLTLKDREPWSARERKGMEALALRLVASCAGKKRSFHENARFALEIYNVLALGPDQAREVERMLESRSDVVARIDARLVPKSEIRNVMRRASTAGQELTARVLLAAPSEDFVLQEAFEEIVERAEQKVGQLRSAKPGARGVLLVESPYGASSRDGSRINTENLERRLLARHPYVDSVLLVDRVSARRGASAYSGLIAGGSDSTLALLARLWGDELGMTPATWWNWANAR